MVGYSDTISWCAILSSSASHVSAAPLKGHLKSQARCTLPESRPAKHQVSTPIASTLRELAAVSGV